MSKVIVATLNWGLGHASRCVPIINYLVENKFTPVLASDGEALKFLSKEFPNLETLILPSYNISYGRNLKWNLFKKIPVIRRAIKRERKILQEYLNDSPTVVGIISDNRFGMYAKDTPSVYITHQVNVLSGFLTFITSFFHQKIIKNFNECWVPDEPNSKFSGKLSKSTKNLNQKYIGLLSRFKEKKVEKIIDILVVLSGPEPNRSQLELKLNQIFRNSQKNIWIIRGVVEGKQNVEELGSLKIFNFMLSEELEKSMNAAKLVVCRSGYSSIMDLIRLNKKALLIPTTNQPEQEYLAKYLQDKGYFKFVKEKNLNKSAFKRIENNFKSKHEKKVFRDDLFNLFRE